MSHLFDSHCHLQDTRLRPSIDAVMQRATEAGVTGLLCCAAEESDWEEVLALAARFPAVRPALGIHPLYLQSRSPDWARHLRAVLLSTGAAVGEMGLDHSVELRNDAEQETVFLTQLQIAADLRRPVSIHCRRAWGRMLELLRNAAALPPALVFHSYSGARDLIPSLAELGGYFSFSGSITRANNRRGHDAVRAVPAERILIETDAPDLLPAPDPAGRYPTPIGPDNEPANLGCIAWKAAELRGATAAEIAVQTGENSLRIFG